MAGSDNADWARFADAFAARYPDVTPGRMMSAPALCRNGKVFAFASRLEGGGGLGARVGRDADPGALGLDGWTHLAPFKTRPPMWDWVLIPPERRDIWDEAAAMAYRLLGR